MPSNIYIRLSACAVILVTLAACGQNYVPQKYTGFPYGNSRTAGSGVEYVRANMAAPKGLQEEAAAEEPTPLATPKAPIIPSSRAEKIFKDFQSKTKSFKLETLSKESQPRYNQ